MLNRDAKQFGKQFMLDSRDDTCWNSDQVCVCMCVCACVCSHHSMSVDFVFVALWVCCIQLMDLAVWTAVF